MPITTKSFGPVDLSAYDRSLPPTLSSQPTIPSTFHDAMNVRFVVFVSEQKVPAENEFDADDSRSIHIVAYNDEKTPIGTIRIVPFPHCPHPLPNVTYWDGVPEGVSPEVVAAQRQKVFNDRKTGLHDGQEPYVKLGRLAVFKEFRGQGIGKLLVDTALKWLAENPTAFDRYLPTPEEGQEPKKFKGLVCAHAQVQAQKSWARWGFVVDEEMGQWNEEGIQHVGMFRRAVTDNC